MRKTVFFLLLSWSITTLNAQIKEVPSSVSLEEAVEWGMIHNRTMQTANLELQKAQKQKWETIILQFGALQIIERQGIVGFTRVAHLFWGRGGRGLAARGLTGWGCAWKF